jgi:hypothetical protein
VTQTPFDADWARGGVARGAAARPSLLRVRRLTLTALALLLGLASTAAAQAHAKDPATDTLIAQSCQALTASTVGTPDVYASPTAGEFPATWPAATQAGLPTEVPLRTQTTTYNRLYEFATAQGQIYGRPRDSQDPWRQLPLPPCFAGRVASISLDDDEMIALDDTGRIFTMDNALKDPLSFNWTSRWGPPVWTGPGFQIPTNLRAWSWSVISPVEDVNWTDPAGNRTAIGDGKVSHIWGLGPNGRRINFWDPWLPLDDSYQMCGPIRGRFKAVNLSASGSSVFVIGRHGDMWTRLYDFDVAGHDPIFFHYSYDDQTGRGDGAPIQLPGAPWVKQPKIPGTITSAISIEKTGVDAIHRILRVEGIRNRDTGYWQRDVADAASKPWTFHRTDLPLVGTRIHNPPRDTSRLGLGRAAKHRYVMSANGVKVTVPNFNPHCSPARMTIDDHGAVTHELLYTVDGLRQAPRASGLDENAREQYGAIRSADGSFETVTVEATTSQLVLKERGWTLRARPKKRR